MDSVEIASYQWYRDNPDIEIDDCTVKLYANGTNVTKTTDTDHVDMFIPHHNIIVQRKSIDEDST